MYPLEDVVQALHHRAAMSSSLQHCTSAQVFQLPSAQHQQVVQQRRSGRLPKIVVSLARYRNDRRYAAYLAEMRDQDLEVLKLQVANAREYARFAERKLASFQENPHARLDT